MEQKLTLDILQKVYEKVVTEDREIKVTLIGWSTHELIIKRDGSVEIYFDNEFQQRYSYDSDKLISEYDDFVIDTIKFTDTWKEVGLSSSFDKFNRDTHGSLYNRGTMDSYYGKPRNPHYRIDGDPMNQVTDLTDKEIAEYLEGYNDNERDGDKKDW